MRVVEALAVAAAFGLVGGIGSYLTTSGLRKKATVPGGPSESGFVKTALVGAVAAAAAWALDPAHTDLLLGGTLDAKDEWTVGRLVTSLSIGFAGAKWLAEKAKAGVFAYAGSMAALTPPNQEASAALASGKADLVVANLPVP